LLSELAWQRQFGAAQQIFLDIDLAVPTIRFVHRNKRAIQDSEVKSNRNSTQSNI
jgi:hypothetical protein